MRWWCKRGNLAKYAADFLYKTLLKDCLAGISILICHGINAHYSSWMKTNDCVEE